jgi:dihydrofolate reductase
MGAATYAAWAGYWPSASGPLANPMNDIPKVVFSDSLAPAGWGETTIAAGDLAEAITRLKQERSGGYLLAHGGTRFARSLVQTGLIDEYRRPPGRPGCGRAALPRAAHHRAGEHHRLQRRSRRPRLRGAPVTEPDRQPGSGR